MVNVFAFTNKPRYYNHRSNIACTALTWQPCPQQLNCGIWHQNVWSRSFKSFRLQLLTLHVWGLAVQQVPQILDCIEIYKTDCDTLQDTQFCELSIWTSIQRRCSVSSFFICVSVTQLPMTLLRVFLPFTTLGRYWSLRTEKIPQELWFWDALTCSTHSPSCFNLSLVNGLGWGLEMFQALKCRQSDRLTKSLTPFSLHSCPATNTSTLRMKCMTTSTKFTT